MKKRILSMLLAIVMVVGLIPGAALTAFAAEGETTVPNYPLWVGSEQFTSAKLSISGGEGTATYEPGTNTLMLNNYSYTGAGYNNAAIYYGGNDELKLVINGTNSVTHTSNESVSGYGVYSAANITVSGEGSLTGVSDGSVSHGVDASGSITVNDGTLSGTGGHYGVHADGSITVNGGSLSGVSQGNTSHGVNADVSITVSGGTLTGTGNYYGVYVDDSITVESGSLIGTGTSGVGVYASQGNITVNGGNLSGLSQGNGSGVETGDGRIMVLGGTLSGTSNGQNGTGVEISSDIIVSGTGSLTGTGGYRGVNSKKTITVTGNGKLTGTGKTAVSIGNESGSSYTQQSETTDETTGRKTVVLVAGTAAPVTYFINVSAVKTADGAALAGATIQIIDPMGSVVEEWVSKAEAHTVEGLNTGEVYTLRATVAPDGYLLPSDITFSIDESGNVSSTGTVSADGILLVEFAKTMVKISAVESGAGEAIAGAYMQILNADGNVVYDWVSTDAAHEITGLEIGEEYTLRATVAPDGYAIASNTTFTIDEKGNIKTSGDVTGDGVLLSVFDLTVVQFSAVDAANGNALAGATMQILDKNGTLVEEWVSAEDDEATEDVDESVHTVTGLNTCEEFTLRVVVAPDGYGVPTNITFSIDRNGMISTTGSLTEEGVLLVKFETSVTRYPLWVGGEQFTAEKLCITDGSGGTATYDPDTNTLTLNNYTYSGALYSAVHSEQDLTIRLVGENSLVNTAEDGEGITVWHADLVISGSGTLNVTADYGISAYGNVTEDEDGYKCYNDKGLLTIQSGTLNITASEGDGLYADGNIKIDNGTFTIDAKDDGIDSGFGDISISGGTLNIGAAEDKGINANRGGSVTITGGIITIQAPNDEGIDVDLEGVFTMSGGTVTIETGADGIDCSAAINISGGTLTITAGYSGLEAGGDTTITGGAITILSNVDNNVDDPYPALLIENGAKLTLGSNMTILKPVGGQVGTAQDFAPDGESAATYYTIVDADGAAATEVELIYKAPIAPPDIPATPVEPTYRPTIEEAAGGNTAVSDKTPQSGDKVTITATPDAGYEIDEIIVTDSKGDKVELTDNGDGTYTYIQPVGSVTIRVTYKPIGCPSEAYSDLDTNAWYHEAADYVLENGLMNGVGNGKFDPTGTTSRAMIWTILARLDGVDTAGDVWYEAGQKWAMENGISDGTMANEPITREQFATILWRYAKYKGYDVSVGEDTNILSYEDAFSISEYAIPAMQWACGAGIIEGDGVNLTPKADATRAQAAALFQRFCENVAEK